MSRQKVLRVGWERNHELTGLLLAARERNRIGDLRLQALTSYSTFKDTQLAKRCLYLHAGVPFADGRVSNSFRHTSFVFRVSRN